MSKVTLFTDIHAALRLPMARMDPVKRTSDRLEDVFALLGHIYDTAASTGSERILCLGDLFDQRHVDAPTMNGVARALQQGYGRTGIEMSILPGNHDAHDAQGGCYSIEVFREARSPGVDILDGKMRVIGGTAFWPLPYVPDSEAAATLRKRGAKCGTIRARGLHAVALIHQSVLGGHDRGWVCKDDGVDPAAFDGFDAVFSGHFHTPQEFSRGAYLGSCLALNFGDDGEQRGYWVMDTETLAREYIDTGALLPQFPTLTLTLDETEALASGTMPKGVRRSLVREGDITGDPGNYVRIRCAGPARALAEAGPIFLRLKEVLKAHGARGVKLELQPEYEAKVRSGVAVSMGFNEMAERYVAGRNTEGLGERALMEMAGRALAEARATLGRGEA